MWIQIYDPRFSEGGDDDFIGCVTVADYLARNQLVLDGYGSRYPDYYEIGHCLFRASGQPSQGTLNSLGILTQRATGASNIVRNDEDPEREFQILFSQSPLRIFHSRPELAGGRLSSMVAITLAACLLWSPVQAAKSPPIWTPLAEKDMALVKDWKKPERATEVGFFRLDLVALRKQIDLAPMDDEPDWKAKRRLIYFPLPDGTLYPVLISRFKTNIKGAPGSNFCPIRGIDPKEPSIEARGFVNRDGIDFRITFKNKTCYFTHPKRDDPSIVASCYIPKKATADE